MLCSTEISVLFLVYRSTPYPNTSCTLPARVPPSLSSNWQTRFFLIFYLLLAVGTFGHALGRCASIIMEVEQERAVARFVARGVSVELIRDIDQDGDGSVDRYS